MSIGLVMPSNHLILCHPLLLPVFPASGSFPMSQLFSAGGQSIGASASVFPMSIQDYILCDWLVWSPYCPRDPWVFSSTTVLKPSVLFYCPAVTFVHGYWKNHNFDYTGLYGQSDVSMLFRFVITFLPRSKRLLISWLQSPSVILELKKIKSVTVSTHLFAMKWCGQVPGYSFFECWV